PDGFKRSRVDGLNRLAEQFADHPYSKYGKCEYTRNITDTDKRNKKNCQYYFRYCTQYIEEKPDNTVERQIGIDIRCCKKTYRKCQYRPESGTEQRDIPCFKKRLDDTCKVAPARRPKILNHKQKDDREPLYHPSWKSFGLVCRRYVKQYDEQKNTENEELEPHGCQNDAFRPAWLRFFHQSPPRCREDHHL